VALLTASEAARRLGVKTSTIYAYVSRGTLEVRRAADGTSRFDARHIEALAARGRPRLSSKSVSINLLIESRLTTISESGVRYRGRLASDLITTYTFEEVAELLWTGELSASKRAWEGPVVPVMAASLDQQIRMVVACFVGDPTEIERPSLPIVVEQSRALIAGIVDSLATHRVGGARAGTRPRVGSPLLLEGRRINGSIAGRLWPALADSKPTPELLRTLNTAMVLLADHELAVSALAVRVAASTLSPPPTAVLAGLGAMAGTLHGGASRQARALISGSLDVGAAAAVHQRLEQSRRIGGFGHRVYAGPDPRATALLHALERALPRSRVLAQVRQLIEVARDEVDLHPNIDLALAAFELAADLVPRSAETIFTVARCAGWIGHVIEEYSEPPLRFRVRAHYTGPDPLSP
jgi:citrate synthase